MAKMAEEAQQHAAQAEKALQTSWLSMKFQPDFLVASMEYSQAATKYRAAGLLPDAVQAWTKSAELKEKLHDLHGAGRAYEAAGAICDSGLGGPAAAAELWAKAVRCFRLAGKGENAGKLILKIAANHQKQGEIAKAKESYEEALEVFKEDEKATLNLGDVYKQFVGFLVTAGLFEAAVKEIDGHIEVLISQKYSTFAHKEMLSKVVLLLWMQDTVRAEQALNCTRSDGASVDVDGWFTSKESEVGFALVAAAKDHDPETMANVLADQTFTFIQIEVARLAVELREEMRRRLASVPAAPERSKAASPAPAASPAAAPEVAAVEKAMPAPTGDGEEAAEEAPPAADTQEAPAAAQPEQNLAELLM